MVSPNPLDAVPSVPTMRTWPARSTSGIRSRVRVTQPAGVGDTEGAAEATGPEGGGAAEGDAAGGGTAAGRGEPHAARVSADATIRAAIIRYGIGAQVSPDGTRSPSRAPVDDAPHLAHRTL